jgi:hypothetical protein
MTITTPESPAATSVPTTGPVTTPTRTRRSAPTRDLHARSLMFALGVVLAVVGIALLAGGGIEATSLPESDRSTMVHGGAGTLVDAGGKTLAALPATGAADVEVAHGTWSGLASASGLRLHRSGYVVARHELASAPIEGVDVAHGGAGTVVDGAGDRLR